jgi:hypothetical protein
VVLPGSYLARESARRQSRRQLHPHRAGRLHEECLEAARPHQRFLSIPLKAFNMSELQQIIDQAWEAAPT